MAPSVRVRGRRNLGCFLAGDEQRQIEVGEFVARMRDTPVPRGSDDVVLRGDGPAGRYHYCCSRSGDHHRAGTPRRISSELHG
jgi:hypothetical protein